MLQICPPDRSLSFELVCGHFSHIEINTFYAEQRNIIQLEMNESEPNWQIEVDLLFGASENS